MVPRPGPHRMRNARVGPGRDLGPAVPDGPALGESRDASASAVPPHLWDRVAALPAFWCWAFVVLFLPLDGFLDYVTGTDVTLTAIYLAPVALVAWRFGRIQALFVSLLCSVSAVVGDIVIAPNPSEQEHAVWNGLMLLATTLVVSMLVGRQREFVDRLRSTALHDPLTGLPNRIALSQALKREFARAARLGSVVGVAVADCDGFKEVNDRLGHAEGDRLLKVVARRLEGAFRAGDIVCRWGGDEFMVLVADADEDGARAAIDRAEVVLGGALEDAMPGFGMSIGWACGRPGTDTIDDLLARADTAMYEAKRRKAAVASRPI